MADGVARAIELGLRAFPEISARPLSHLAGRLATAPRGALGHVLAELAEVQVSEELLTPTEIRVRAEGGASVIAEVEGGWLVVTGEAGRGVRGVMVGRGSERRVSARKLAALVGPRERVTALVLEPYLALESLSCRATGLKTPWARLRSFMALERSDIAGLVVYAIALGGLSLAVPVAVQVLVNTIAFGSLLQPLVVLALLLLAVLAFSGFIQVASWYAVELLLRRIFVRTAEDFARRLVLVRPEVHDRTDTRELVNRFFEVVALQKATGRLLLDGLGLALNTAVGMALLAFYHPVLLAFDIVLVVALGMVIALGYGAVPSAIRESRAKYRVAAWLEEIAMRPGLFATNNAGISALNTADALTRDYLAARRTHYRRILRQLIGGVGVQTLALVALLGMGGWLVMRGELTLGQLVAAELVVGAVGAGFVKIGKHLEDGYDLVAGLDKLGKVIDLPVRRGSSLRWSSPMAGLVVDGVTATKGQGPASRPVHFAVSPEARHLVVGKGGTGKSALLEVLAGWRAPASGSLRLGKLEVRDGGVLRERTWLLRPGELVTGTVLDNLRLADPFLDEQQAWAALQRVKLDQQVAALPGGLHAEVRSDGTPLSVTEANRLAAARALVAAADILLIDRGFDQLGLDGSDKKIVLDVFLGAEAPWAAVVVSEDPAVRHYCDVIISLDPLPEEAVA